MGRDDNQSLVIFYHIALSKDRREKGDSREGKDEECNEQRFTSAGSS
jgi:hypothetical protein